MNLFHDKFCVGANFRLLCGKRHWPTDETMSPAGCPARPQRAVISVPQGTGPQVSLIPTLTHTPPIGSVCYRSFWIAPVGFIDIG